jgi:hypothetical protein
MNTPQYILFTRKKKLGLVFWSRSNIKNKKNKNISIFTKKNIIIFS